MKELAEKLAESRAIYLESVAGADPEEASWRAGGDRWSILDCAEHVANVEFRIFRVLQKAPAIAACPPNPSREDDIYTRTRSRAVSIPAPEQVRPIGRYASLAEAAGAFADLRDQAIRFLEAYGGDLRAVGAVHPILGPCNGYEYALIMAAHPIRHADQIREIREAYRRR